MNDAATDSAGGQDQQGPSRDFKQLLAHCTAMLEAAVARSESRFVIRLLRHYKTLRSCLVENATFAIPILKQHLQTYATGANPCRVAQMAYDILNSELIGAKKTQGEEVKRIQYNVAPLLGMQQYIAKDSHLFETKVMLCTLALVYLIDSGNYKQAMELGQVLAELVYNHASRIMDYLAAKAYFYYSRAFELGNSFQEARSLLMNAYRKACIHHDVMSQAVTLNCLLRDLLHHHFYSYALKLITRTSVPEYLSSNAQYARYYYYYGKILAVQLEYSEAYGKLVQALQKAPQNDATAHGFKLAATKLSVIVSLLMGDVPYKSIFTNPAMRRQLVYYEKLVLAVLKGDLNDFAAVSDQYADKFERDGLTFLIKRLRQNVIKSGLRRINLSYSKIHLADVAAKLGLSPYDCESTIAKAIHDGIIEAEIEHEQGFMKSRANVDIYKSDEPIKAFTRRIDYCLKLHSHAIQAMRYPDEPDMHKDQKTETSSAEEDNILQIDDDGSVV